MLPNTLAEAATGPVSSRARYAGPLPRCPARHVMPCGTHDTTQDATKRAEGSHQPPRHQERQMRGFTALAHAQRFLRGHGVIQNLVRLGRPLRRSVQHRMLRARSFTVWAEVTAA